MNSPIPVKPATLPKDVRELIARAMGYADADALLYWGTGGAAKRFDDTCAALAALWPATPALPFTFAEAFRSEPARRAAMEYANQVAPLGSDAGDWERIIHRLTPIIATALKADGEYMLGLLRAAKCPCCDGSGAYMDGPTEDPQAVQCEWCDRRASLVKRDEASALAGQETLTKPVDGA